jgi:hypothetical protein
VRDEPDVELQVTRVFLSFVGMPNRFSSCSDGGVGVIRFRSCDDAQWKLCVDAGVRRKRSDAPFAVFPELLLLVVVEREQEIFRRV